MHTQKTEAITVIDARIRIQTSRSRSEVDAPRLGGPPPIDCHATAQLISWSRSASCCWSEGLWLGWMTVLPLVVGSWASCNDQRPCTNDNACREASARRSQKTFGPHGGVPAYDKDSTKLENVSFEAPFGGLGSFSCKRTFLLEECLLRATISVVSKDGVINLRGGRTLLICPFFAGWASSLES